MYYFKVSGVECSCDTADELLSVIDKQASDVKPLPLHPAYRPVNSVPVSTEDEPASNKRKPRRKHRRKADKPARDMNAIKDLPYIAGGITWDVAKKIGKKVGRTDLMQLRSDLFQRQKLGE